MDYEDAMISIIPANFPHAIVSEAEDSWEFLVFDPDELIREMYPDNPKKQQERLYTINQKSLLLQIDAYPDISATAWRILEEQRASLPHHQDVTRNLLKVLLLELLRIHEGIRENVQDAEQADVAINQILPALRFMEESYAQEIRASELAEKCGLSEPHFRRLFAESINMSPMEYLNLTRIRKACRLISRRDCSMVYAASECGFPSVSTFTRNFKKLLGMTPYQWKLRNSSSGSHLPEYNIYARKGW
jgi:AraC-like DNA-binding protein